jgi:hypothetical protein
MTRLFLGVKRRANAGQQIFYAGTSDPNVAAIAAGVDVAIVCVVSNR